jgi:hypothetical protein
MTRRALMLGGVALGALACNIPGAARAEATITLEQFLGLSGRLTGVGPSDLDQDAADKIIRGLVSIGRGPGLAFLAENAEAVSGTVAEDIVAAWYSGVCATAEGEILVTFTDALVWNALDFSKPFGSCGGETGYWAAPPEN